MKTIVLGDLNSLLGISQPSKVSWLMERGIRVNGVQIISLASDMLPKNLLTYHEKLLALVEKFPFLKRVSVALNCWPLVKEDGGRSGVAASTFLSADQYFYPLGICRALQKVHEKTCIEVDISYHPMLTWPTADTGNIDPFWHQKFLWDLERSNREKFTSLLNFYIGSQVGINVENEPVTSDPWGNLTHSGNRLFSEMINYLPATWGVTADLQHCGMMLGCLERELPIVFPPYEYIPNRQGSWNWEHQFLHLENMTGSITFHVAQVDDYMRHVTPPIRWDDPIMPWPLILRLMQELDEAKDGEVWYGVEIDGGHLYPEGYKHDLEAFLHLQKVFGK